MDNPYWRCFAISGSGFGLPMLPALSAVDALRAEPAIDQHSTVGEVHFEIPVMKTMHLQISYPSPPSRKRSQHSARRQMLLQEQPLDRLLRKEGLSCRRMTKNHETHPARGPQVAVNGTAHPIG